MEEEKHDERFKIEQLKDRQDSEENQRDVTDKPAECTNLCDGAPGGSWHMYHKPETVRVI